MAPRRHIPVHVGDAVTDRHVVLHSKSHRRIIRENA
jgi:hypothetical protein